MGAFKEPHGGELKELYLPEHQADEEKIRAAEYPSWDLSLRQLCDLDLLLNGAFSPLEGFLNESDYEAVCNDMRLTNGVIWPIPITLDVTETFASKLKIGDTIALRDAEGVLIATMEVSDRWEPDKASEAKRVFGTTDDTHPGVNYLMNQAGTVTWAGRFMASSRRLFMISNCCATHHRSCAAVFASWGGAKWSRSRPVIHCTAHTRN